MASRHHDGALTSRNGNPGPSDYKMRSSFHDIRGSGTISKSKHASFINPNANPGPGDYKNESIDFGKKSPRAVIGSAGRYDSALYKTTQGLNPGPGNYSSKNLFGHEGKGSAIVPKRKDFTPRAGLYTPAPGHYKSESDSGLTKHVYNVSFGGSKRTGIVDPNKSGIPGPVDYYTEKMIQFKKKMPVAVIGSSKR